MNSKRDGDNTLTIVEHPRLRLRKKGKPPVRKPGTSNAQIQVAGIPLNIAITEPKARSKKTS
jgi:hypothetical protein